MIAQEKSQPIYLLNQNSKMRLQHCCFAYKSNAWIIQVFKLVYEIKLSDTTINNFNNNQFSLNIKADNREKSELDINMHIILALLNKIIKGIKDL